MLDQRHNFSKNEFTDRHQSKTYKTNFGFTFNSQCITSLTTCNNSIPDVLQRKSHFISLDYYTKYSICSFKEPRFNLKTTEFAIHRADYVSGTKY